LLRVPGRRVLFVEYTDSTGAFVFQSVPKELAVNLLASDALGVRMSRRGVTERDGVVLELALAGAITGRVGGLVSSVFTVSVRSSGGVRKEMFVNPDGEFRVDGIPIGDVNVSVASGDYFGEIVLTVNAGVDNAARIELGRD
jgi:hypothetical protein